jgi:phage terminase small subunit
MRGRRPKPVTLHLLHGTYRRDRHGSIPRPESATGGKAPSCPRWLSPEARRKWRELAPELHERGLLTAIDQSALAVLCTIRAQLDELRRAKDLPPAMQRHKHRLELMHIKWLREFGMSPASRAELQRRGVLA